MSTDLANDSVLVHRPPSAGKMVSADAETGGWGVCHVDGAYATPSEASGQHEQANAGGASGR